MSKLPMMLQVDVSLICTVVCVELVAVQITCIWPCLGVLAGQSSVSLEQKSKLFNVCSCITCQIKNQSINSWNVLRVSWLASSCYFGMAIEVSLSLRVRLYIVPHVYYRLCIPLQTSVLVALFEVRRYLIISQSLPCT